MKRAKRLTAALLCLLLLTGCGGNDDFVSVMIVETETTQDKPGFIERLEDWWYDIWYTFFADDRTKAAIAEAEESLERENG